VTPFPPGPLDARADPVWTISALLGAADEAIAEEAWPDAEGSLRAALALCETLARQAFLLGEVLQRLAHVLEKTSGPAASLPVCRRFTALLEAEFPQHPQLPAYLVLLGLLNEATGREVEGARHVARAVALVEAGADDDPTVLAQARELTDVLAERRRYLDAAERLARKRLRGVAAGPALEEAEAKLALAGVLVRAGRGPEALFMTEEARAVLSRQAPLDRRHGDALRLLGQIHLRAGAFADAEASLRAAQAFYEALPGPLTEEVVQCRHLRALALRGLGNLEEAFQVMAAAVTAAQGVFGEESETTLGIVASYADLAAAVTAAG
jgi:tetratricopeptide (TPR) repeat protein